MREESKLLEKAYSTNELLSKKSMNFGAVIALNKQKEDHESQEAIKQSSDHENEEEAQAVIENEKKKSQPKKKKEELVYLKDIEKINKDIEKIKNKAKIKQKSDIIESSIDNNDETRKDSIGSEVLQFNVKTMIVEQMTKQRTKSIGDNNFTLKNKLRGRVQKGQVSP